MPAVAWVRRMESPAVRDATRIVEELPVRGRILDWQGRVLVENRASNVIAIDRAELDGERRERVVTRLAALLGRPGKNCSDGWRTYG